MSKSGPLATLHYRARHKHNAKAFEARMGEAGKESIQNESTIAQLEREEERQEERRRRRTMGTFYKMAITTMNYMRACANITTVEHAPMVTASHQNATISATH